MNKLIVNNSREQCPFDIDEVERVKCATFVGMLPLKTTAGQWDEQAVAIFWNENPPNPDYSKYFALFSRAGKVYIADGSSAVSGTITGIVAEDGEIIYSICRHDYRWSKDGSVMIDGGRDYTKCNNPDRLIEMKIVDGHFYQL